MTRANDYRSHIRMREVFLKNLRRGRTLPYT